MNPWQAGSRRPIAPTPAVREELAALYRDLDARVSRLGPRCELSGRCCRFEEYGHDLFATSVEMGYLVTGEDLPSLTDYGPTAGRCPLQQGRLCSVREHRPMGCRLFYCDPRFEDRLADLYEHYLEQLKSLCHRHGLEWNYRPFLSFFET